MSADTRSGWRSASCMAEGAPADTARTTALRTPSASSNAAWASACAAAEASPDAYRDGPVAGAAVGFIDGREARWTRLRDRTGRTLADKAEGLALDRRDPRRAWIVLDLDRPDAPSELVELELSGAWPA